MASARKIGEMIALIKTIYPYYSKDADSIPLAKTWLLLLQNVSDEIIEIAFMKCLQTCKVPPTPADVLEQVKALEIINAPTDEELWVALTKAVRKAQEHIYNFGHTFIESNGKTQGENARNKFQALWDNLPKEIKSYLGGKGELMRLAKYNDEEMMFEKKNFLKTMPAITKRQEYTELSQMLSGGDKALLEKENGQNGISQPL